MKHLVALLTTLSLISLPARADNPGREFLMSCTYGVLAGTLVGAATLAFTDKPGQNLNRVARGASFGLYAGILLGFYVVYIVPGLEGPEEDPIGKFNSRPFDIAPVISPSGIDGMQAQMTITRF